MKTKSRTKSRTKLRTKIYDMTITQTEIAKKTGLTQTTIANLITGKTDRLKYQTVLNLCKALECEANEILSGRDMRRWQEDVKINNPELI